MQAMIMLALFGAMMAAVAGIISTSVDSTQQFITNQVMQTQAYFRNVHSVLVNQTVPANLEIPYQACPDGTSYDNEDVKAYLCQRQISRLAQWAGADHGSIDPWKNQFTGYVLRKETPIYASAPNHVVSAPITAMILVSAGPDRKFGNQIQLDLAALRSTSTLNDVLRIAPPNPTTCTVAAAGSCDDVVYSFTDQTAQQNRWKSVQAAVDRIAASAMRNYEQQFRAFKTQIPGIVDSNLGAFTDASGNLIINDSNINIWQGQGVNAPSFNTVDLNSETTRTAIGVDEEFRYITDTVANGGSSLRLTFTITNSTNGFQDVLTMDVSNNASPWGRWATGGGALSYRKIVQATAN